MDKLEPRVDCEGAGGAKKKINIIAGAEEGRDGGGG